GLEPTREMEIVDEIAQHLEDRHADLVGTGMTDTAAAAAVLAELDDGDMLARKLRPVVPAAADPVALGASRGGRLADLAQDLRYALRALRKSPAFAMVTILSLAIGIGANAAIFQLLSALHLKTLAVSRPG